MTASEFNALSTDEKGELLTANSVFIEDRVIYGKYKIIMYALNNLYVEVYLHIKHNEIETVKALDTLEDWESYMQSINLELLF